MASSALQDLTRFHVVEVHCICVGENMGGRGCGHGQVSMVNVGVNM